MTGLLEAGYFLFSVVFTLIIFALWLRILFRYDLVSKLDPVCRAIDTVTNPLVKPVSLLFSKKSVTLSRFDWPSYIVLIIVEFLKFLIMGVCFLTKMLPAFWLVIYVISDLIVQPFNLLFYAIVIRVIMSWLNQGRGNLLADVLRVITEPLMRFSRSCIPPISGFDFSPLLILIVLKFIVLFITSSLPIRLI